MPTTQEISAEELAKLFYSYHESLATDFACAPEGDGRASWELAPRNERKLMVATARRVLLELSERHPGATIAPPAATTAASSSRATRPTGGEKPAGRRGSVTLGEEGKECGC
jgi:hypothetical protein